MTRTEGQVGFNRRRKRLSTAQKVLHTGRPGDPFRSGPPRFLPPSGQLGKPFRDLDNPIVKPTTEESTLCPPAASVPTPYPNAESQPRATKRLRPGNA